MPSIAYIIEVNGREVWRVFDAGQARRFAEVFSGASVREKSLSTPDALKGCEMTWDEMCPRLSATVLVDGHVDHITGPRCMIKMDEGAQRGLCFIAHTSDVLKEGQKVLIRTSNGVPMQEKAVAVEETHD